MEPIIFDIEDSELIFSSSCDVELKYLASVNSSSEEISLTSGGKLFDYKFEIYIRGSKSSFDMPEGRVGRMLSAVKRDIENKIPLKINLNVSMGVIEKLFECYKSKLIPRNLTLFFHDDDWFESWDNLCKFKLQASEDKNLFFVDYKIEI